MSEPTPIERKKSAESRARICRQEIERLSDRRSEILQLQVRPYREGHGYLSSEKLQMVKDAPLRAFMIQHLEAEALRYEREANRLRFEVIAWAEDQRAAMQAEISEFNAKRL